MIRHWRRKLVHLLAAAQLLLAFPLAHGMPATGGAASGMDCATMMQSALASPDAAGRHCPCCPDGVTSMTQCAGTCSIAAAIVSAVNLSVQLPAAVRIADRPRLAFPRHSDPPLKPPPIR